MDIYKISAQVLHKSVMETHLMKTGVMTAENSASPSQQQITFENIQFLHDSVNNHTIQS